jgi:hypothetical protein
VPYLKFSRDKRGYEYFSLIEPGVPRRGRPARPRLLFWFRTPPQVKVGRHPFTDEVQRAIEQQNPGVRFDWPRLLSTPIPPPDAEHWRERRRAEKAAKMAAKRQEEVQGVHEVQEAEEVQEVREVQEVEGSDVEDEELAQAAAPAAASDSAESGAVETPAVAGGDPSGGSRRRNRRRRRRRHNAGGRAAPGVAPAVPAPPSEEV